MKKKGLVGIALIVLVVLVALLITGLKRVPQGSEALLVSDSGRFYLYRPGWHFVRPMSGKWIIYPVGELNLRYPKEGSWRVLLKDGREAEVAFSFRIHIPSGSVKHLYRNFGEELTEKLDEVFCDAVEIQAARFVPGPGKGAQDAYTTAVAGELREALSDMHLSLVSAGVESWKLVGGEGAVVEANVPEKPLRKIVFIGVDAGDWLIINPLIEKGKLPNFKKIVEGGASGPLRSMEPMLSPLLWTTMATGKLPEEHGILSFTVMDPKTGKKTPITRMYRKVDAFWNMMTDYGRSVDIIGWLATYPAEKVNGTIVADRVGYLAFSTPRETDAPPVGAISPPERYDEITDLIVKIDDVSFDEMKRFMHIDEVTFNENKSFQFGPERPINNMILLYATALTYHKIALHLLEIERPDFLGVYFEFVDAVGHLFMPYAPPQQDFVSDEEYRKFKDAIGESYILQDRMIGEMLDRCDENTVVMIVSDHGFKSGASRLKSGAGIGAGHAAQWHEIEGIVCLYGNGIRPGYRIEGASLIDVAPTILALAGFPHVNDMPGKAMEGAFEPSLRESLNPASVATLERDRSDEVAAAVSDGTGDDAIMKKLEALGYLTPENPDALNNLGQRYQKKGEYEKAIVEFKKALALKPNFASALNNIGVCYGKLERYAEAEKSLLKAIAVDPKDIFAMNNLAVMYLRAGRVDQARHHVEKALEIEPKYANAHFTLGSIFATVGEFELAEREFKTAIEIEPKNSSFRGALEMLREQKEALQQ